MEEKYRKGSTSALNCDSGIEFATNVIVELHSDNQRDYYVKVRHDGKYVYLCEREETACPWSEFKRRAQAMALDDSTHIAICG